MGVHWSTGDSATHPVRFKVRIDDADMVLRMPAAELTVAIESVPSHAGESPIR